MLEFGRQETGEFADAERREWLVTNGLGGFASQTIAGSLTRRYHGLLFAALGPPAGRTLMLAALDEVVRVGSREYRLSTLRWADGTVEPRGYENIDSFALDASVPVWSFALGQARVEKRVFMEPGANVTYVTYRLTDSPQPVEFSIKALVDYRSFHGTTRAESMPMAMEDQPRGLRITAYPGAVPFVIAADRGSCARVGIWYLDFGLTEERARGLDDREDHFCAGEFTFFLAPGESATVSAAAGETAGGVDASAALARVRAHDNGVIGAYREAAASYAAPAFVERLALAADQFVVRRGSSPDSPAAIIAGYHWFGEWGRDTMIALPGLLLATGRASEARSILRTWATFVDEGMLPNDFPGEGSTPSYNSVDSALWFVQALREYHDHTGDDETLRAVFPAVRDILTSYRRGTRYAIHADPADGLLYAGVDGVQLTWMDAKVGDWVVTPRIGKPVEVNALWHNALATATRLASVIGEDASEYAAWAAAARRGFSRFWNGAKGYCFDVIDGPSGDDPTIRPNQLFAASLPEIPFAKPQVRAIVDACARLLVPCGVRTLDAAAPAYVGTYEGPQAQRDAAYHQGTAWAWLLGALAAAHLRAYGDPQKARDILAPLETHLSVAGIGSVSEIFDGDAPNSPRGCIAQAWSVAEALRAYRLLGGKRSSISR
jgi:predicted glycogen debranching enzyme